MKKKKERREYAEIAPAGPTYARAVRADQMLFISGCTARGTDAEGGAAIDQLRVTLWTGSSGLSRRRADYPTTS